MPNWAITDYVIEGPNETLLKIQKAIEEHEVEEGSSENWEGNVLKALGIEWDRKKYYTRGFIQEASREEDVIIFYAEEAWGTTDFGLLLESKFPDIKVYYQTEEEGLEVYVTNDVEGKHFKDRWYVDTCVNGNYEYDYFIEEEDMWDWLCNITNGKVKSMEDAEAFNEEKKNTDDYIGIHEFKILEPEEIKL